MMQPEPEPAAPETHDDGEPVWVSQAHDRLIDKMRKELETIQEHLSGFTTTTAELFDERPPDFTVEQWDGMIDRARELETALGMHSAHALEKAGDPADSAPIIATINSLHEEFDQLHAELMDTKKELAEAEELAEAKLAETEKELLKAKVEMHAWRVQTDFFFCEICTQVHSDDNYPSCESPVE